MIRKPCWQGLCGNIAQALLWNLSTCIRRLCRNFHIVGRAASLSVSQFAFIVCPVSAIQQSTMAMKYNSSQCLRTKRNKHNNASTNVPFLPAILLLKLFALHIFFFLFCYHFFFLSILSVRRWYLCLFCITLEYEKKNSMQSNENRRIKRNNGKCASRSLSCRHNRAIATDSRLRSVHNNNICLQLNKYYS